LNYRVSFGHVVIARKGESQHRAPVDVDASVGSWLISYPFVQRWLDARGIGFDREAWKAQCKAELELHPPKSMTQAHLTIKSFLGRGPADPYTRFVLPEDFQALKQYDVSGVGLNLSSLSEYVAKVGPLPRVTAVPAADGVYVVGTIKVQLLITSSL
jgi:hypothetical protein